MVDGMRIPAGHDCIIVEVSTDNVDDEGNAYPLGVRKPMRKVMFV